MNQGLLLKYRFIKGAVGHNSKIPCLFFQMYWAAGEKVRALQIMGENQWTDMYDSYFTYFILFNNPMQAESECSHWHKKCLLLTRFILFISTRLLDTGRKLDRSDDEALKMCGEYLMKSGEVYIHSQCIVSLQR